MVGCREINTKNKQISGLNEMKVYQLPSVVFLQFLPTCVFFPQKYNMDHIQNLRTKALLRHFKTESEMIGRVKKLKYMLKITT